MSSNVFWFELSDKMINLFHTSFPRITFNEIFNERRKIHHKLCSYTLNGSICNARVLTQKKIQIIHKERSRRDIAWWRQTYNFFTCSLSELPGNSTERCTHNVVFDKSLLYLEVLWFVVQKKCQKLILLVSKEQ